MKPFVHPLTVLLFVAVLSCSGAGGDGAAEDQAIEVAERWLELVDGEEYEASWTEAASIFRSAVTSERWQQQVKAARTMFGEIGSRNLKSAEYTNSMPGAADGEYVIIQFEATFANKKTAIETVTPMQDTDGVWRVAGYYIK